jgi:hypothetical protein
MEDRFVLLKIKREFTENEAVLSLLKIIKELELEIGMLKSENAEALNQVAMWKAKAESLKILAEAESLMRIEQNENDSKVKINRQILKDELIIAQKKQIRAMETKLNCVKKDNEYWQNKYCMLAAQSMKLCCGFSPKTRRSHPDL